MASRSQAPDVQTQLIIQAKKQEDMQTDVLKSLFKLAYYLFRSEIPHTTSNWPDLVASAASVEKSNALASAVRNSSRNAHRLSSTSITGFLHAFGEAVASIIKDRIPTRKPYSVLADECTDINGRQILSVCVRSKRRRETTDPSAFDELLNAVDEESVCTEHSSAIDEVHHCDPVTQADNEPFLVEASTMTEDSVETSKLLFFCCEKDGDGTATQIESVPTVDVGTACPGVQYETKGTGTIYKEVYFGGYKSIVDDEQRLLDLTGVTLVILAILRSLLPDRCRHPRELDINDKLILFLMKMKHGLPFSCLASLFGIHRTTAAKIFKSILLKLCAATRSWLFWPSRAAIRATMPPSISLLYPNCRVIIDCTELKAETPPGVEAQNMWYSHYKGTYTIKYRVGIAPNGLVTFLSPGFGGRANDTSVTVEAGVLPLLEPGDLVLADKGFPGIRTGVGQQGATLVMPPFATKPQFTEAEADATYDTASIRIHVERVIQRLRIFDILNTRIPQELAMYMDKIMHIICVLTNLRPGIFRKVQPTVDDTQ
ncbi:uncharacterized protein LOC135395722 [Ornithodoros turicata]|uniref:uncharacterized protein LOC135395722 n=1 Tax=Ornithodoros turicata TaxID=34597 RepID=UPI003139C8DD